MKTTSESCVKVAPDSGLTNRLHSNQAAVRANLTETRMRDPIVLGTLLKYCVNIPRVNSELGYLNNLTNAQGLKFCRSMGLYSDIEKQLDNFAAKEKDSFMWNVHAQRACQRVMERYSKAHLRMVQYHSLDDIYQTVTDWNTSAGWSGIVTGYTKKKCYLSDKLRSTVLERERAAKQDGTFGVPMVCWFRTQGSGAYSWCASDSWGTRTHDWKAKKRLVIMDDILVVISESRFGKPLTDYMKAVPQTGVGKDDIWIKDWVSGRRADRMSFISLDYSKYDSTIPSWLIHRAFDVIRSAFDVYDTRLLEVIEHDFIHKDVYGGRGLEHFDHGNPSGSRLTTIINCICNEIITETWADKFGMKVKYNILGDDNLIYTRGEVSSSLVDSISQYIEHNFGIKCNVDKDCFGTADDDPKYLSRYWSSAGAYRPLGEILSMLVYPEKRRNYDDPDAHLTPEIVLWSYTLAYPACISELIDVSQLSTDVGQQLDALTWTKELRESIPYNVRLWVEQSWAFVQQKLEARNKLELDPKVPKEPVLIPPRLAKEQCPEVQL